MRSEKQSLVNEIKGYLKESGFLLLADCRGLTMAQLTELRDVLRASNARMQVARNSSLEYAGKETGYDDLSRFLTGPTAMITGTGDVTETVKGLARFISENQGPAIKGGVIGADILDRDDVVEMSRIPAREVLLARFVGTVAAPMSRLVGVMSQKLMSLLYVLKAVEEKKSVKQ